MTMQEEKPMPPLPYDENEGFRKGRDVWFEMRGPEAAVQVHATGGTGGHGYNDASLCRCQVLHACARGFCCWLSFCPWAVAAASQP